MGSLFDVVCQCVHILFGEIRFFVCVPTVVVVRFCTKATPCVPTKNQTHVFNIFHTSNLFPKQVATRIPKTKFKTQRTHVLRKRVAFSKTSIQTSTQRKEKQHK